MWLVRRIHTGEIYRVHHEIWRGGYLRGVRFLVFEDVSGEHLAQCFELVLQSLPPP